MRLVIIESPYRGATFCETLANKEYARRCVRDALQRGESPLASHLLYTQDGILDDANESERALGIAAGHAWMPYSDCLCVYIDRGISEGMEAGIKEAEKYGVPVERRRIDYLR